MGFFTKVDYNRQLRQSGGTAVFSGSTHLIDSLTFGGELSGYVAFFKQRTAYGILRSDWSSDVCSSD
eukprot:COSAG01_NODE_38870_length_484_cov_0.735065_1_plen_66_part_10